MNRRYLQMLVVCSVLLGAAELSLAACDQTLSPGANVASAVANAANNTTICLNNGNYGTVAFNSISRTGFVTVRSTTGQGATIRPTVGSNSRFIRFQSLTMGSGGSVTIGGCAKDIEMRDSTFISPLSINNYSLRCTNYPSNIVIDGNVFGNLGPAFSEGRIDLRDNAGNGHWGVTISNNKVGPGCLSDGVQLTGTVVGVTIGPGNIFDGINQSGTVHCDAIQFYADGADNTIIGNWFRNSSVAVQIHCAGQSVNCQPTNTVFRNNIITNVYQIQIGGSPNFVFEHNTVYNGGNGVFRFGANPPLGASTGLSFKSNILIGTTDNINLEGTTGTLSHNLCGTTAQCSGAGTNQIIGTPTFVGGSPGSITTFAGWQLATGSLGSDNGHDGRDRGANYNSQDAAGPTAPASLVIQ
jgi:hypothetical protein